MITKNYFYCLTSEGLKLETDYIKPSLPASIGDVFIKNFTVDLEYSQIPQCISIPKK